MNTSVAIPVENGTQDIRRNWLKCGAATTKIGFGSMWDEEFFNWAVNHDVFGNYVYSGEI